MIDICLCIRRILQLLDLHLWKFVSRTHLKILIWRLAHGNSRHALAKSGIWMHWIPIQLELCKGVVVPVTLIQLHVLYVGMALKLHINNATMVGKSAVQLTASLRKDISAQGTTGIHQYALITTVGMVCCSQGSNVIQGTQ